MSLANFSADSISVQATTAAGMSIADVPQNVQDALEAAWKNQGTRDNMEMNVKLDTKGEVLTFTRYARAWCEGREGGKLSFRKLPRKSQPGNEITFKLSREIAPASDAAKDAAAKGGK